MRLASGQRQEAAQAARVGRGEPVPRVPPADSSASRSSVRSWLPMAITVRVSDSGVRNRLTRTAAPGSKPCSPRGMRTMPSARTSDISTPEPLASGEATTRSPTWPTVTRRNSSSPSGLTTLRVIVAWTDGRRAGLPEPARQRRLHQQLARDGRGDGVAGEADDGNGA